MNKKILLQTLLSYQLITEKEEGVSCFISTFFFGGSKATQKYILSLQPVYIPLNLLQSLQFLLMVIFQDVPLFRLEDLEVLVQLLVPWVQDEVLETKG